MRGSLALAVLLTVPAVAAYPASTLAGTYEGVATEGSRDFSQDWPWWRDLTSTQAFHDFLITLVVDGGDERDVLLIEAPAGVPHTAVTFPDAAPARALATRQAPATLWVEQSDGCEEFTVIGLDVRASAPYHVRVDYGLPCALGAC